MPDCSDRSCIRLGNADLLVNFGASIAFFLLKAGIQRHVKPTIYDIAEN